MEKIAYATEGAGRRGGAHGCVVGVYEGEGDEESYECEGSYQQLNVIRFKLFREKRPD